VKSAVVFLRGGGLGDFILTLPLVKLAYQNGHSVRLYGRSQYLKLLDSKWSEIECLDIDELNGNPPSKLGGSIVVSFWNDKEWKEEMKQAGAKQSNVINPRPQAGDSFLMQACLRLGWELPANYMTDPILDDHWNGQDRTFWIHPGSGGLNKNFPLVDFLVRAQDWLESRTDREVVFSFGEADKDVKKKLSLHKISQHPRVRIVEPETVFELKNQLLSHADQYLGNDSGPGHLAANLGIPTEIWFRSTNAVVWKPTGPRLQC
jgi:ADP-heptose:LPS heptosyltransferase